MRIDDFHFLSLGDEGNELTVWNKDLIEIE